MVNVIVLSLVGVSSRRRARGDTGMIDKRVRMGVGLGLFVLGLWRLLGGATASPLALLPEALSVSVAILSLAIGYWLYRSSCST